MKKRINFRKLGRTPSHKWAMLCNMVTSLIEHERIVTTVPKAKEVQGLAEKLVTMAKENDLLHARRQCNKIVRTAEAQTKLINVLGPRYAFRDGGYTRVLKLARPRAGDKADMAVIEYVDRPGEIRAARPPTMFQKATNLEDVFRQLGISDETMHQLRGCATKGMDDAELEDLPAFQQQELSGIPTDSNEAVQRSQYTGYAIV